MYIKAEDVDGTLVYLNTNHYVRFTATSEAVEAWTPDNLCLTLRKTKELKEQLDALCSNGKTSKGLEKFG